MFGFYHFWLVAEKGALLGTFTTNTSEPILLLANTLGACSIYFAFHSRLPRIFFH